MRASQRATVGGFVLALAACGSDVTESLTTAADASDSSTSDDSASTGASMTAASMSISDEGSSISAGSDGSDASEDTGGSGTEASSGNGEGGSDGAHAESDSGDGDDEDDEGQDAETSAEESTGSPVDCAPLDEDACEAAGAGCMALVGSPLVHENGPFWCIAEQEFAGCMTSSDCGRAETVGCEDGGSETWLFPSTCLPTGWNACEPPGNGDYDACG